MDVPGYLDGRLPPLRGWPLVDGAPLMLLPGFWPAFLRTVGGAAGAPDAFDADLADLDVLLDELSDPDRWPVFTVSLRHRTRLRIVLRNHPDDAGVDYLLDRGDGTAALRLAVLDGHGSGPALSWPELRSTIDDPAADHTAVDRYLLLLPALGDLDTPAVAHRLTAHVLTTAGAVRDQSTVAGQLLDTRRYWAPSTWTTVDGVAVCLGPNSPRHPRRVDVGRRPAAGRERLHRPRVATLTSPAGRTDPRQPHRPAPPAPADPTRATRSSNATSPTTP